jgi:predicted DNA-binding protein
MGKEEVMSKTVTLRLNEKTYKKLKDLAEQDNRPLSNFIETATLRYIEEQGYVDEFEMEEIRNNAGLNRSLKNGIKDAKSKRGRFV